MDSITISGQDRRSEVTAEHIARLSAKREEIILILRQWHGYSHIAARHVNGQNASGGI